jgi:hypothetical protein
MPHEFHPKQMKITYLQPKIIITSGNFSSKIILVFSPSVLASRSKTFNELADAKLLIFDKFAGKHQIVCQAYTNSNRY